MYPMGGINESSDEFILDHDPMGVEIYLATAGVVWVKGSPNNYGWIGTVWIEGSLRAVVLSLKIVTPLIQAAPKQ